MPLISTRLGANATPLPAALPPLSAALSRRAALFGAVAVAGVSAAGAAPAAGASAAPADAHLLRLCADLHAVDAEEGALVQAHPGRDCDDMPGWGTMERRRSATLALIAATPAMTMAGVIAKCRVQQTDGVQGLYDDAQAIGTSIADDLVRMHAAGALS